MDHYEAVFEREAEDYLVNFDGPEGALESSARHKTVEKAKKMLGGEELKIWEIANQCGVSESGFRKEFQAETGLSPTEYGLEARTAKAKYLPESTDMNVSEITDALHFYDAAYFCRMFKPRTGLSPMQFAKRKQL